tara:strand:- start:230 stop:880 length:651 start_codon:yes stop_codon:yes gene_type:complete
LKDTIFISFYTPEGRYPELALKLKKSLDKFNLKSHIVKINRSFRTWEEGTYSKSSFILQSLLKFRSNVVWLDIDTEVWKYPHLLMQEHDFAIYNWFADNDHHLYGKIPYDPDTKSLFCSGGVQKYGYTAPSIHLLLSWIEILRETKNKTVGDDPFLDTVFNKGDFDLHTLWLPKTYNRMDKHSNFWSKINKDSVVINHDYKAGGHRITDISKTKGF